MYLTNALYNGGDNGKCIARLAYDQSPLQKTGTDVRDLCYHAFDEYTSEPARKMMLNDLFDQTVVNKYKVDTNWGDKWMYIPPYKGLDTASSPSFQRKTAITETSLDKWYITKDFRSYFDYEDYRARYNMYTEPVMAFAVKRAADDGGIQNCFFEDGTLMLKYKSVNERLYEEDYKDLGYISYHMMLGAIFINGNPGAFGMKNATAQ